MLKRWIVLSSFIVLAFLGTTRSESPLRVMFYNVENLFDCIDDSLTNDAEFLPGGMRGWNYARYKQKLENISKVIVNVGGWDPPAIVGLCEIESDKALRDLTRYSGLKNLKYKYVHFESPDQRGIDVALLYQPTVCKVLAKKAIPVRFKSQPKSRTRDILYVKLKVHTNDSLHVFVCHFPSRLGGELESEGRRKEAATILRQTTDSIFSTDGNAKILMMGDFNDYPTNESMLHVLGAKHPSVKLSQGQTFYNLMFPLHLSGKGTHKHNGQWGALDQIIVSHALMNDKNFYCTEARIFEAPFLLMPDENGLGNKPYRTYNGMTYQGGFSDHLPLYVDFWITP